MQELLRRPRSFLLPLAILSLLALILLYPSAMLDGILLESSAAVRTVPADLIVFSRQANGVMPRSRVEPDARRSIEGVDGVARAATFDVTLFTGTVAGRATPLALALLASNQPLGLPGADRAPAPGEALADTSLRDKAGVVEGSEILVGPQRVPVRVTGFVTGANLWFGSGLVVDKRTWRATFGQNDTDPASVNGASQAVLVQTARGADANGVAKAIDAATGGQLQAMTRDVAVSTMPGVGEQELIFGYVRLVTLGVALVVVALFLSFLALERAPLYAMLKAIGASSSQLLGALVMQVVLITVLAVSAAALVTYALTRLPYDLTPVMRGSRVVETLVALLFTAVLGSGLSFRRVVRVDPAEAIG